MRFLREWEEVTGERPRREAEEKPARSASIDAERQPEGEVERRQQEEYWEGEKALAASHFRTLLRRLARTLEDRVVVPDVQSDYVFFPANRIRLQWDQRRNLLRSAWTCKTITITADADWTIHVEGDPKSGTTILPKHRWLENHAAQVQAVERAWRNPGRTPGRECG